MAGGSPAPQESDPLIGKGSAKDSASVWDVGVWRWIVDLKERAGFELLATLFVTQHLHRGFLDHVTQQSINYVYKLYSVPATRIQIYSGITTVPWALKPVIGLISDIFPIGGYSKAPYMAGVSVLGTVSMGLVGFTSAGSLPVTVLVACFFCVSLQMSTNDLLTEAKYAEKIREVPAIGSNILTYVWFGMTGFGLAGTLLAGVMAKGDPQMTFGISVFVSVLIFVPLLLGYMQERRVSSEEAAATRRHFFAEEGEACFLSVMMFIAAASITVCGLITGDPIVNGFVAIGVVVSMMISVTLVLSPIIAKFTLFSMLQSTLTVSTSGAGFYFMTDSPAQYPEGPHFSPVFYTSVLGTLGSAMSLVGILLYQRYMSTWNYRYLFLVSNIAYSLVSFLDLMLYTRVNKSLGIPDHLFVLSTNVLQQPLFQWQWMPQVVLLSYLCPPGMEATMYALLAGCHNLGGAVSSTLGSFVLKFLHCEPNGALNETAQFKNLWIASAISTVLPLITVIVLLGLIPDANQGEKILEDSDRSATMGSLWRRWRGVADRGPPSV
mmetsp:Transcript_141961/g.441377  ORF Transcript_141961/g.441377 Transcript_141961/m.441377 type:complete len:550 (-) Transcript_141961:70-1719(-)